MAFPTQLLVFHVNQMTAEQLKIVAAIQLEMLERYYNFALSLRYDTNYMEHVNNLMADISELNEKFTLIPGTNQELANDTIKH